MEDHHWGGQGWNSTVEPQKENHLQRIQMKNLIVKAPDYREQTKTWLAVTLQLFSPVNLS
jgi:hypothetical protein